MGYSGHILGMVARERTGRPDGRIISMESLDAEHDGIDAVKVVIADVPDFVSGPNKGRPNYGRCTNRQPVFILDGEAAAWLAAHPEICGECANERRVFVSWRSGEGTRFKPCPRCPDQYDESELVLFEPAPASPEGGK
jgi:hypothetical protein